MEKIGLICCVIGVYAYVIICRIEKALDDHRDY